MSDMPLPDEMIETAADAIANAWDTPEDDDARLRVYARAALSAVLPLIRAAVIEECAKIVARIGECTLGQPDPSTGAWECGRQDRGECNCFEFEEAAEEIRALAARSTNEAGK